MTSTHKLRLDGTPRKFARFHGLSSPHVAEPRAILCVGRYSTGMVFAGTLEELDAAFCKVTALLRQNSKDEPTPRRAISSESKP